jgi:hypothetical protein
MTTVIIKSLNPVNALLIGASMGERECVVLYPDGHYRFIWTIKTRKPGAIRHMMPVKTPDSEMVIVKVDNDHGIWVDIGVPGSAIIHSTNIQVIVNWSKRISSGANVPLISGIRKGATVWPDHPSKCQDCDRCPFYGHPNGPAIVCSFHTREGYEVPRDLRCVFKGCGNPAVTMLHPKIRVHCRVHSEQGPSDFCECGRLVEQCV